MTTDPGTRPEDRPTLANLRAAVSGWLKGRVGSDDLVFIYFAGQALSKLDSDRAQQMGKPRDFLLPVDFTMADVDGSGWALDRQLTATFDGKVQVFCCVDSSTAGRGFRTVDQVTSADRLLKALAPWPGWAAWIAADNGEAAPDSDRGRPGSPLRHRLIEALGTPPRRNNMLACLEA